MADVPQTNDAERLIELLSQQRDLYERLRKLADQQRGLISSDTPERLLDVLRERQTLVTRLAQLNVELAPYRRNWGDTYGALPEDTRERAAAILGDINGMLQVILKSDREDSALLSARKQMIANEVNEVSGGQTANAAYARQARHNAGPTGADVTG